MGTDRPRTVGELRSSGYRIESVKDEMRRNLVRKLRAGETLFPDILGYEETVFPQIQNAILSRHDVLLLGLRGQAKTRMLRQLVHLLDEFLPVIAGSELNDHPYHPISKYARELVAEQGDATPITWIRREQRYHEKLATPDVTIADLIGEVDMIKHAEGRYLSSELTMHFGLIPRTNHSVPFNPAFATEISLIDPLPHQRIAVYDRMLTHARLASCSPTTSGKNHYDGPVHS